MRATLVMVSLLFLFTSCMQNKNAAFTSGAKLDSAWLTGIINNSDTAYTKPYYRTDFVTASYYRNKKDSTLCQVMKDSLGRVRQITITKNEVRTFFARYFTNGQAEALLPVDEGGKFHGDATSFYEDGIIKSKGQYKHGLYYGKWQYFDEKGALVSTGEYDENGQKE